MKPDRTDFTATEPISELVEGMIAAHEMFLAMVQGGFTEKQALYLLGVTLAMQSTQGPTEDL